MPQLERAAFMLNQSLSQAKASAFSGPIGSATAHQGYHFGIECLFPSAAVSQADNVALIVSACHLDREPRLSADVCWGHPSGQVEVSLSEAPSEQWPFASAVRVDEVISALPRLLDAFSLAAKRGPP